MRNLPMTLHVSTGAFQNSMQIANASQSHRQRNARVSDHAAATLISGPSSR
jgi:hypothetical protein